MSYPAASVALLDGLRDGDRHRRSTPPSCASEAMLQRERLDQLVDGNDEHQAMVAQLEQLYDAAERGERDATAAAAAPAALELRSGDELAAEVERFLRDQGKS